MKLNPACIPLDEIVHALGTMREQWNLSKQCQPHPDLRPLPSADMVDQIIQDIRGILFPMYFGPYHLTQKNEDEYITQTLGKTLETLKGQMILERSCSSPSKNDQSNTPPDEMITAFALALPKIRKLLESDVIAAYHGDPAALSLDEVLLCYPSIEVMTHHRVAHLLYQLGFPLLARMIATRAHRRTGIDIHPGAQIGASFFIDHGTGVVIGETTIIGERVRLYQAVTLGAKSFPTNEAGHPIKGQARHPIVENDVVIYAGATVLGRITIGEGASIGGNLWVTNSVPAHTRLTQAKPREGE